MQEIFNPKQKAPNNGSFSLKYEGVNKQGKTIFGDKFVPGLSNRHLHVQLRPGLENMAAPGARENEMKYKAVADQHSLDIKRLAELVDPEETKKIKKDAERELSDSEANKILKKNKVWQNESTGGTWMRETSQGTEALWRNDATGNLEWRMLIQTMQNTSQYSANGR